MMPPECPAEELLLRLLAAAAGVVALLLAPERASDFVEDWFGRDPLLAAADLLLAPRAEADCLPEVLVAALVVALLLAEAAPFFDVAVDPEAEFLDDDEFLD